jgi:hypothetical protein
MIPVARETKAASHGCKPDLREQHKNVFPWQFRDKLSPRRAVTFWQIVKSLSPLGDSPTPLIPYACRKISLPAAHYPQEEFMSKFLIEGLAKVLREVSADSSIAPGPAIKRSAGGAALKRCRAAWQRAYNATMAANGNRPSEEWQAVDNADKAYCNALPLLYGYEGIRDVIACVAHGVVIGAVPPEKTGQLLYAAQVAISSLSQQPRALKASPARTSLPPTSKTRRKQLPFPCKPNGIRMIER